MNKIQPSTLRSEIKDEEGTCERSLRATCAGLEGPEPVPEIPVPEDAEPLICAKAAAGGTVPPVAPGGVPAVAPPPPAGRGGYVVMESMVGLVGFFVGEVCGRAGGE